MMYKSENRFSCMYHMFDSVVLRLSSLVYKNQHGIRKKKQQCITCLRGSLPKSGPLNFATKNTFALFFVGEEALVGVY